jgi:hypothetical protein
MFPSACELTQAAYAARFLPLLRPRVVRDVELVTRAGAFLALVRALLAGRALLLDAVRPFCLLLRPRCELEPRTVLERRLRTVVARLRPLCRLRELLAALLRTGCDASISTSTSSNSKSSPLVSESRSE